jgi:hypothetical protein
VNMNVDRHNIACHSMKPPREFLSLLHRYEFSSRFQVQGSKFLTVRSFAG